MEPKAMSMDQCFAIVKRRKWSLILPAFIAVLTATIVALALPSIYKSTSLIHIEEQDIPDDFVKTTVTSYVEQRLQLIYQRIASSPRLLDMINRFNLYPDLKQKWTTEEIVVKMRDDITLEPISVETADTRRRGSNGITIAFTLSYEGKNPSTVHRITNILTSMFLEENLQDREKQAKETTEFLENEMERVKTELAEIDKKMAAFKKAHINELPELLQVNMQSLNNIENNIARFNEQLRGLKEREGYLQNQLASIPRQFEGNNKDKTRLAELKVQLVHLRTRFSEKYPDVIKTKAEIADLQNQINNSGNTTNKSNDLPDNPAYITLSSQLSSTQADILSVKRQISEFNQTADMYRLRIANTPKVEEAYNAVLIDKNNTHLKYDDLMRKHMEAKVAQGLEKEQKGQRFTLIDPAKLPEKPYKPNRPAIILIGFVLAIGASLGWAWLREMTDLAVRDSESLTIATSFPVLASIPEIVTKQDIRRKRIIQVITIIGLVLIISGGLAAFHYLVMDLNIFWAKLMRKLSL